jgi:Tfp pilus assembly protein PilF
MLLKADANRPAYDDLARALALDANDAAALDGLLRAAGSENRLIEAEQLLKRLSADPAHTAARLTLSRALAAQGDMEPAMRIPIDMLQVNPADVPALEQLASILSDIGDATRLEPVVQRLLKEAPKSEWAHYYAASLFFLQNRPDVAVQAARNAVAINPANAKAHNLIGAGLASMGNIDAARTAFEASIKEDPKAPATYTNLATLELQAGNRDLARQYFAEALAIDPTSQTARDGINSIR